MDKNNEVAQYNHDNPRHRHLNIIERREQQLHPNEGLSCRDKLRLSNCAIITISISIIVIVIVIVIAFIFSATKQCSPQMGYLV